MYIKRDSKPIKKQIIDFLILLQHELKDSFTFQFNFVGSASRNMITREISSNEGYDFDLDLKINFKKNKIIPPDGLKQKIMDAINNLLKEKKYKYLIRIQKIAKV